MEAKTKDLWVLVETDQNGGAKNVGLELLNPGRRLAEGQQGKLVAVVIGSRVDEAVKAAQAHGADQIIVVDGPEFARYTTDAYTDTLYALVEKYGPGLFRLCAHTGRRAARIPRQRRRISALTGAQQRKREDCDLK